MTLISVTALMFVKDGRYADKDNILPDGFIVRRGDGVNYIAYAMGRMPHIWGEDSEDFRPERWLTNGTFQPESPFKFIAFHVRKVFFTTLFFHEAYRSSKTNMFSPFRMVCRQALVSVSVRTLLTDR